MTQPSLESGASLVKYLGKALDGPAYLGRGIAAATLLVAEAFFLLISADAASNFRRLRDSMIAKAEGESRSETADADRRSAEAAAAANHANLHKRRDAIAKLEREKREAEVEKTKAEAAKTLAERDAILKDAETRQKDGKRRQKKEITDVTALLAEAISRLRQEGGDVHFDEENLKRIIEETHKRLTGGSEDQDPDPDE